MQATDASITAKSPAVGLGLFERYLSAWVALCMIAGVLLGREVPNAVAALRQIELGRGSQINLPIAFLIWLMITAMMMRVDFSSIRNVGKRPRGLAVTLFVNWLVKPFSMALIAWFFFRHAFSHWIAPAELPVQRNRTLECPGMTAAFRWSVCCHAMRSTRGRPDRHRCRSEHSPDKILS